MFFKLFNSNKPIVLFLIPLFGLILWIPSFFHFHPIIQYPSPFYYLLNFIQSFSGDIIAFIIICITGVVLANIVNRSDYFFKNHYLSAFIYVLLMSCVKEYNCQNPIIYANLFFALGIGRLFMIQQQITCKNHIFLSSCFMLIAALFHLSYLFFLPLIWIVLLIIRPFELKEWIMPIICIVMFALNLIALYSVLPNLYPLNFSFFNFNLDSFHSFELKTTKILYGFYILLIIGVFISMIILKRLYISSRNSFKKLTLSLLAIIVLTCLHVGIYYFLKNTIAFILIQAIPLSIIMPFMLIHVKKKWVSEVYLIFFFFLLIVNVYFF